MSVICDAGGQPRTVTLDGTQHAVAEVVDTWLIEDEWWRTPIARRYVEVMLADGRLITLFEDLVGHAWYRQGYR